MGWRAQQPGELVQPATGPPVNRSRHAGSIAGAAALPRTAHAHAASAGYGPRRLDPKRPRAAPRTLARARLSCRADMAAALWCMNMKSGGWMSGAK
jgi:hypothetical protein